MVNSNIWLDEVILAEFRRISNRMGMSPEAYIVSIIEMELEKLRGKYGSIAEFIDIVFRFLDNPPEPLLITEHHDPNLSIEMPNRTYEDFGMLSEVFNRSREIFLIEIIINIVKYESNNYMSFPSLFEFLLLYVGDAPKNELNPNPDNENVHNYYEMNKGKINQKNIIPLILLQS